MSSGTIIFVDDDETLRHANRQSLSLAGFNVETFADATSALAAITADFDGVVVSDIRLPDIDGLQLFKAIQKIDDAIPVILITGHGDVPMAVASLKAGVHDFLTKPFSTDYLVASARRAAQLRSVLLDNRRLRQDADLAAHRSPLIGETPAIQRLRESIVQIAAANVDVIVEGETGTGKKLVASMLHRNSIRRSKAFVAVSCSSAAPEIIEAELFGEARLGGTRSLRTSQVEVAHQGTLLLDDIDHLSISAQSRLMRVLEGGVIAMDSPGASRTVDLKIIASCKGELLRAVKENRFREDLYYRLDMSRLRLPPLRQRRADLPLLFAHFVNEALPRSNPEWPEFTDVHRQHLSDHDWPGNARELKTFAIRFALGLLEPEELSVPVRSLSERVRLYEEAQIRIELAQCGGDVAVAADILKLPKKTLYDKLVRHGIDLTTFRSRRRMG